MIHPLQPLAWVDLECEPDAAQFVKDETVRVVFAREDGELESPEGPNRYRTGDALITGSTGGRWSVSRDRFDAKYFPVPPGVAGADGAYRARPLAVWAKQMRADFSVRRSAGGDVLRGVAGDWLLQYAPGDYGIVEAARFSKVYRRIDS